MIDKWGFSENEENWSGVEFCYDTKEEAIAAGNQEVDAGDRFYVGQKARRNGMVYFGCGTKKR